MQSPRRLCAVWQALLLSAPPELSPRWVTMLIRPSMAHRLSRAHRLLDHSGEKVEAAVRYYDALDTEYDLATTPLMAGPASHFDAPRSIPAATRSRYAGCACAIGPGKIRHADRRLRTNAHDEPGGEYKGTPSQSLVLQLRSAVIYQGAGFDRIAPANAQRQHMDSASPDRPVPLVGGWLGSRLRSNLSRTGLDSAWRIGGGVPGSM